LTVQILNKLSLQVLLAIEFLKQPCLNATLAALQLHRELFQPVERPDRATHSTNRKQEMRTRSESEEDKLESGQRTLDLPPPSKMVKIKV
jgi:hypothetical protein